mmetsp:Transcript_36744/g.103678  ORF Transcript_36744/g.103678 Transcript_36744/m.103678 type:complete len:356 (-) Transcript_36744:860-1927(-)
MGMGFGLGLMETLLFKTFSVSIIKATGAPDRVVPLAATYMEVRGMAAPAVLITLVCQAGLLAQKDASLPSKVVIVSCFFKCLLNFLLLTAWEFGAVEAAVATMVSQYLAFFLLLYWNSADPEKIQWSWNARLTIKTLGPFARCLGPLTGIYMLKNLCYILVNTAANSQEFLAVAAHQSLYSVWVLLAFCATPLERAAITFLPTSHPNEVRDMEHLLIKIAACAGIGMSAVVGIAAILIPDVLTQDERVWGYMREVAPQAMLSLLLHSLETVLNGILLARQDLVFLLGAMCLTLVALYLYIIGILDDGTGLPGVWWGMVVFVGLRCVSVSSRYFWQNHSQRCQGQNSESRPLRELQ